MPTEVQLLDKMFFVTYKIIVLIIFYLYLVQGETTNLQANIIDLLNNPEETGPYFEGDIRGDIDFVTRLARNGLKAQSLRWPNAVVPYEIKGSFSEQQLSILAHALNQYHEKTCVRFRKRTYEKDYVVINNSPNGCWSSIGRQGGAQVVNLESPKCFSNYGTTIHELMHALGFYHEQNRFERDSYVRVLSENVRPGMMANFQKLSAATATGFGVNYDYGSVMHYKSTSFSKNDKPTLVALTSSPEVQKMGQRNGFSEGDIQKINAMYKCF